MAYLHGNLKILIDVTFRPAGWDNEKKIAILYENMHTIDPEAYYTDVIVKPQVARKVGYLLIIFFYYILRYKIRTLCSVVCLRSNMCKYISKWHSLK